MGNKIKEIFLDGVCSELAVSVDPVKEKPNGFDLIFDFEELAQSLGIEKACAEMKDYLADLREAIEICKLPDGYYAAQLQLPKNNESCQARLHFGIEAGYRQLTKRLEYNASLEEEKETIMQAAYRAHNQLLCQADQFAQDVNLSPAPHCYPAYVHRLSPQQLESHLSNQRG